MSSKTERKKPSKLKKALLITLIAILALLILAFSVFYGIFFNEVNALASIKKEGDYVYSLTYKNDYFFDEFLQSGASDDAELQSFIMSKLLHGLPINFDLPDYGCTSFTAFNSSGNRLLARNLDLEYAPVAVVRTRPKNGYASLSLVNLSALGFNMSYVPASLADKLLLLATPYIPFDGVNSQGVAICVNMVNGAPIWQNTDKIDLTTTTLIRLVLDKAGTVREAVELVKNYDLHDSTGGPYHFQIADSSGDGVIVEYYDNKIQVIESADNRFQVMTNHALNGLEREESTFLQTYERYATANARLTKSNGVLSTDDSLTLLQDVKLSWGEDSEYQGGTLYSAVYDLNKRELTFIFKCNRQQLYKFAL